MMSQIICWKRRHLWTLKMMWCLLAFSVPTLIILDIMSNQDLTPKSTISWSTHIAAIESLCHLLYMCYCMCKMDSSCYLPCSSWFFIHGIMTVIFGWTLHMFVWGVTRVYKINTVHNIILYCYQPLVISRAEILGKIWKLHPWLSCTLCWEAS